MSRLSLIASVMLSLLLTPPAHAKMAAHPKKQGSITSIGAYVQDAWITSGTTISQSSGDNAFSFPIGITFDAAGNAYVATLYRILKYNSSGVFQGWIGGVLATPSGGAAGCNSTASGQWTPGWCTGGAESIGGTNGLRYIVGIVSDATYLYVVDQYGTRVLRFNLATGAFAGWIGRVNNVPTGGDAGCSTAPIGSFTPGWCIGGYVASVAAGDFSGGFSFPNMIAIDASYIYVSDSHNINRYAISNGAFGGWIGRVKTVPTSGDAGCTTAPVDSYTPGWCIGGDSKSGSIMTGFNTPQGMTVTGGYLYLADYNNSRVVKIDVSTGAMVGWIGRIAGTLPSGGGAGCAGAADGTYTPNWCVGGNAGNAIYSYAIGGFTNPRGITNDGTYLYVTEYSGANAQKVALADGAYQGWIGTVLTTPSAGVAGCTSAAPYSLSPGWCKGGTRTQGDNVNSAFHSPFAPTVNGTNLFVPDSKTGQISVFTASTGAYIGHVGSEVALSPNSWSSDKSTSTLKRGTATLDSGMLQNSGITILGGYLYSTMTNVFARISRFNLVSGSFAGWIGSVSNPKGMTGTGCTALSPGSYTPNWCMGGLAGWSFNTGSGKMAGPQAVTGSGNYLYVFDGNDYNIKRYNVSDGSFAGWIGLVSSTPTGGAAGCTSTGSGTVTPGWCTGGFAQSGNIDGAYALASVGWSGIANDGTYLYHADSQNRRISKINMSTGVFVGWIGRVNSITGLGGGAGCAATVSGAITPAWCTGGTSQSGTAAGAFGLSSGVAVYGGELFVVDYSNHRIEKFNASTGAFIGWLGQVNSAAGMGGDAGCATAVTNQFTPGWCTGGTSKSGSINGALNTPIAIHVDEKYIFVSDTLNGRISRYDRVTGAFKGWRGVIATTPTGGDPGCTTAAVNSATPGWCTGGTGKATMEVFGGLGPFVAGLTGDAKYVYASDYRAGHIFRFPR